MPEIVVLGSGTSTGVPEVGCTCDVCRSKDPRDKRLRTSQLYITDEGKIILIDCGPDFRQQALKYGLDHIDAILLTHEHYDHIGGLDDLRTISWSRTLPVYAEQRVLDSIKQRLHYYFHEPPYPGSPQFELHPIEAGKAFEVLDEEVYPIRIMHAKLPIVAYRIGDYTFMTDVKTISPESLLKVEGTKHFFVTGLRYKVHLSHQTIDDAIDMAKKVGSPEETYLIHLSHHAPTVKEMLQTLPSGIYPAIDDMRIKFDHAPFRYEDCGKIDYSDAHSLQIEYFERGLKAKKEQRKTHNVLLFCEHQPVLTIGRHGDEHNLIVSEKLLEQKGIELHRIERGGDITYHGPGQITGYPIFDLEQFKLGVKKYIFLLEQCIINLLDQYHIKGERLEGATGVWIEPGHPTQARKICAIGVKCSRYITMHGFALNVNTDLSHFSLINPCGFTDKGVTSMEKELGHKLDFTEVKRNLQKIFLSLFHK